MCEMCPHFVGVQVVASGVSGWKHGAAEVSGTHAEQQRAQMFVQLENVSEHSCRI